MNCYEVSIQIQITMVMTLMEMMMSPTCLLILKWLTISLYVVIQHHRMISTGAEFKLYLVYVQSLTVLSYL